MKKNLLFAILGVLFTVCESYAQNVGDKATFDLKGNVASVYSSVAESSNTALTVLAEFSPNGKLKSIGGMNLTKDQNGSYEITRNAKGQIVSITSVEGDDFKKVSYRYNNTGQVVGYSVVYINGDTDAETLAWTVTRKFGTNGQVISEDFKGSDGTTMHYTYTYSKIDGQGNWTERLVSETSQNIRNQKETREITYN
ncbi:MAG: hypothetical protein IKS79_04205 [Bacteroidales bacterium]|nr:hypothetical protein [Bacteroidales bacterium]